MDLKEAFNVCRRPKAKAFIVGQDTKDLLAKDSKTLEALEMDGKLADNDNPLYTNYLYTLLDKKDVAQ